MSFVWDSFFKKNFFHYFLSCFGPGQAHNLFFFVCVCAVQHAMIVTEYMENGALDRYLRVSSPHTIFSDVNVSGLTSMI